MGGENYGESEVRIVREVGDLDLRAPFPIRSAFLTLCGKTWPGTMQGRAWERLHMQCYNTPLKDDSGSLSHCYDLVFVKDLRKDASGAPIAPNAYSRWVIYSGDEYRRFEAEEKSLADIADRKAVNWGVVTVLGVLTLVSFFMIAQSQLAGPGLFNLILWGGILAFYCWRKFR